MLASVGAAAMRRRRRRSGSGPRARARGPSTCSICTIRASDVAAAPGTCRWSTIASTSRSPPAPHGVHLRGRAVSAARVRPIAPAGFLVGRSVHSVDEARRPRRSGGCDYLVFGTVFETASKPAATRPPGWSSWRGSARGRAASAGDRRGDRRTCRRGRREPAPPASPRSAFCDAARQRMRASTSHAIARRCLHPQRRT